MPLSNEQVQALSAKLDPAHIKDRQQSGRFFSYIEGWHAIAEANRIFGFDAWTREMVDVQCVNQSQCKIGMNKRDGWSVSYIARVKITACGIVREGTGAGHGTDVNLGLAHESAIKEAETDAMKRALMTFGNPFGLALYDKDRTNVASYDPDETSSSDPIIMKIEPTTVIELISDEEYSYLMNLIAEANADIARFKQYMGVEDLSDLPKSKYADAVAALNAKKVRHVA